MVPLNYADLKCEMCEYLLLVKIKKALAINLLKIYLVYISCGTGMVSVEVWSIVSQYYVIGLYYFSMMYCIMCTEIQYMCIYIFYTMWTRRRNEIVLYFKYKTRRNKKGLKFEGELRRLKRGDWHMELTILVQEFWLCCISKK